MKNQYCCPDCGSSDFKVTKELILGRKVNYWICKGCGFGTNDPTEIEDTPDETSPACRACGNPSYPLCMDSCKLFDD